MRLIFHIGTHKTGTTSIQNTLDNNIDVLKNNNIRYFTLHKELKFLHKAFYPEMYGVARNKELYDDAINKLAAIITATDFDTYIISGEDMSGYIWNWTARLSLLSEIINFFPEAKVEVIVYFRNPVSSCVSIYQELVKGNKFLNTFDSFISDEIFSIYSGGLDWYFRVQQIINIVNPGKLIVKCFEVSVKKGLVEDFLSTVGLSDVFCVEEEKELSNRSMNMSQLAEMMKCNENFDGAELKAKKNEVLLSDIKGCDINGLLDIERKNKLLAYYYEDNLKLFDEYIFMPINEKWIPKIK